MKDSLWGKEIRWSKMDGRKYSTGTGAPAPELKAKKGYVQGKEAGDSDSSSDFDSSGSDVRPAKVKSSKKVKRTANGGIVMFKKKTIVGGDSIKIEGSKIVNITTGGSRRNRDKDESGRRRESDRENGRPDFFFPKIRGGNQSPTSLPGSFLQIEYKRVLVLDQQHLIEVAKSVGKVCAPDYCGTCFRVGFNYVMTARYVLKDIVNNGIISLGPRRPTSYAALDNENVYVNFNFLSTSNTATITKFYLTSNVVFEDEVLDIAVVELKPGPELPPPFRNFSQPQPGSKFTFVGHPSGEPKQLNQVDGLSAVNEPIKEEAVEWSRTLAGYDGFAGMDAPGRILFNCSFQKGGSGSPGIALVGEQAVVVTVLLHGYPDWFYDPNFDQNIKNSIGNQQRIEQGVSMKDLYFRMQDVNAVLRDAIFGRPNE